MRRSTLLALLSTYLGSCGKRFDTNCPSLDQVRSPATYTGSLTTDHEMWDVVLEIPDPDTAVLSWSDPDGDHVTEYTVSIEY